MRREEGNGVRERRPAQCRGSILTGDATQLRVATPMIVHVALIASLVMGPAIAGGAPAGDAAGGAAGGAERPATPAPPLPGGADPLVTLESLWRAGLVDSFYVAIDREIASTRRQPAGKSALLRDLLALRGQARARLGQAAEAEPDLREAVRLAQEQGVNKVERASLRWLALTLQRLDRSDEAIALWKRLLSLSRAAGDSVHQGWALVGLAYQDELAGRSAAAEDAYREALGLFRATNDHRGQAHAWNGLGTVEQSQGRYVEALASYRRAVAIADSVKWRWLEGLARNNTATLLNSLGDPGEARAQFLKAYELELQSGDVAQAAFIGCNAAACDAALERYDEAAADVERIQQDCRAHGVAEFDAMFGNVLAWIRRAQGRPHLAAEIYAATLSRGAAVPSKYRLESLVGLSRTLAEMDSLPAAIASLRSAHAWVRDITDPAFRIEYDIELGQCLLDSGRGREALSILEPARRAASRLGLREPELRAASLAAWAADGSGEKERALLFTQEAVRLWECERGLPVDPEWREIRGASIQEVVALRGSLLLDLPPERPVFDRVRAAFDSLQVFKARTLMERMLGPAVDTETYAPATAEGLQTGTLRPGEVLLDFYLGKKESLVFAITSADIRAARLPPEAEIEKVLDPYLRALSAPSKEDADRPPRDDDPDGGLDPSSNDRIARMLLGPVLDVIEANPVRIVVPDGALHRVSFAALLASGGGIVRGGSKTLMTVPSATIFERLRLHDSQGAKSSAILALAGTRGPHGETLAGATGEVRDIARRLRGATTSIAHPESALSAMREFGLLHLAGHALIDEEHPWRSTIELGAGAGDSGAGGTSLSIPASAIVRSRLHARLAVLSACRSASGRVLSGEGVRSLAGSFLVAGVPSVVASLWPVDDLSTRRIMRDFYDGLARGRTVSDALSAAQTSMRRDPRTRQPYAWAGFVVVGDGSLNVPVERRSRLIRWPVLLILLGGITLAAWGVSRYTR